MHHQILTAPPFLTPGQASRLTTWTGTAIRTRRTRPQAQEIDVDWFVGDDVELKVARQHALLAVVDFEIPASS